MQRAAFAWSLTSVLFVPAPSSGPSPAPSGGDEGSAAGIRCEKNPGLPYDRRLEIVESVLDGPEFRLSNYRGYVVWLNIFATWCPPCRAEQADVVALAKAYRDRGLRTFGVFAGEADDAVRAYRKKYDIDYPLVRDDNGILTVNLQGTLRTAFPAHLFITAAGMLSCYTLGELDTDKMKAAIVPLLQGVIDPATQATG